MMGHFTRATHAAARDEAYDAASFIFAVALMFSRVAIDAEAISADFTYTMFEAHKFLIYTRLDSRC